MIILAGILNILIPLLTLILVVVAVLLVLVCLMQRPKNEGLGSAFGGGMTDQMFGAQTTNVLQKATVWLGILFFSSTLVLAILQTRNNTASEINTGVSSEQTDGEGLSLAEQLDKAEAEQKVAQVESEEPAPSLPEQPKETNDVKPEETKIQEKATDVIETESEIIEDAKEGVENTIQNATEGIKATTEKAADTAKTITEPVTEVKTKAVDAVKNAIDKTSEGASNVTEGVKGTGSDLIDATKKKKPIWQREEHFPKKPDVAPYGFLKEGTDHACAHFTQLKQALIADKDLEKVHYIWTPDSPYFILIEEEPELLEVLKPSRIDQAESRFKNARQKLLIGGAIFAALREEAAEIRFDLWTEKQPCIFTKGMLAMIVGIAVLQVISPMFGTIQQGFNETVANAGLQKLRVQADQSWRIWTAPFLHGNHIHIFMNASGLWYIGRRVEILTKWPHLLLCYLISILAGSWCSFYFLAPNDISVGASGGLMGLLGFLLIFEVLHPRLGVSWIQQIRHCPTPPTLHCRPYYWNRFHDHSSFCCDLYRRKNVTSVIALSSTQSRY